MPRALRICSVVEAGVNCPHIALEGTGRCELHQRQPWEHAEASRHARGYGHDHARRRLEVLLEEWVCFYCGRELLELVPGSTSEWRPIARVATLDHKIPKAQGGTDDRYNLAAACRDCQQAKASREGAAARHATAAA